MCSKRSICGIRYHSNAIACVSIVLSLYCKYIVKLRSAKITSDTSSSLASVISDLSAASATAIPRVLYIGIRPYLPYGSDSSVRAHDTAGAPGHSLSLWTLALRGADLKRLVRKALGLPVTGDVPGNWQP